METIAESRVSSALRDAGLSDGNASCMATRMVDRLSLSQLRKLEGLKAHEGERERPVSLREFTRRVERVGDAEVIAVTASSAGLCALGIAKEKRS